jgi:hypothetical protein
MQQVEHGSGCERKTVASSSSSHELQHVLPLPLTKQQSCSCREQHAAGKTILQERRMPAGNEHESSSEFNHCITASWPLPLSRMRRPAITTSPSQTFLTVRYRRMPEFVLGRRIM